MPVLFTALRSQDSRRRRVVATAFLTGLAFVVGIAFAQWLATGTGSGSARAQVAEPLTTVDAAATATADLYPGAVGDLSLRISNPNPYPVVVSSVTGAGSITSDTTGCDVTNHAVTFTDQTGLALAVPAGGTATHTLADAVAMGTTADQSCQGAVFTVPVQMSGYSGDAGSGLTPYYTGPAGTEGVGACQAGLQDADGNVVEPEVTPVTEVADNGIDDDCDGQTDEPQDCAPLPGASFEQDESGNCTYTCTDDGDPTTVETFDPESGCTSEPDPTLVDADNDGWTADQDCDDTNAGINPGATEIPGNGVDEDCDGIAD